MMLWQINQSIPLSQGGAAAGHTFDVQSTCKKAQARWVGKQESSE